MNICFICCLRSSYLVNETATTESETYLHTLSRHDPLPISTRRAHVLGHDPCQLEHQRLGLAAARTGQHDTVAGRVIGRLLARVDRKSTRLNSSHSCAARMPSSAGKKKQKGIEQKVKKGRKNNTEPKNNLDSK